MPTDPAKLKRSRTGHRAAATRRISEIEAELALADPDQIRLAQLRLGIRETLDKLKQLEDDLLPHIADTDVVTEIEQNEKVKDEIFSALAKIEVFFSSTTASVSTPSVVSTPPAAAVTSHTTKLPKLTLRSFQGNLTGWGAFWDAYKAAVHSNASLSNAEKFAYLSSLLEGKAKEAIAGLSLTDANYDEAVSILEGRFGDKEKIISAHMNAFMTLECVHMDHHTHDLRRLYDKVEANIRGLEALRVKPESYGALLTPVLVKKLPAELRLNLARKIPSAEWSVVKIMKLFKEELEARERAIPVDSRSRSKPIPGQKGTQSGTYTSTSSNPISCCYCGQEGHSSTNCKKFVSVDDRKRIIRESNRCFNCLRKGHVGSTCRSLSTCKNCRGKHHTSICMKPKASHAYKENNSSSSHNTPITPKSLDPQAEPYKPSTTCHTSTSNHILLQTATVYAFNLESPECKLKLNVLMDSGSQSSYITKRACRELSLRKLGSKPMSIMTFGNKKERQERCGIVKLGIETRGHGYVELKLLSIEHICEPIVNDVVSLERYPHLKGLDLAFDFSSMTSVEADILLGSDQYWRVLTAEMIRVENGPTAIDTQFGWVLSGPVIVERCSENNTSLITHVLRVDSVLESKALDKTLKAFWDIESLGILEQEDVVQNQFDQHVSFENGRYTVSLPWRDHCLVLPTKYDLCLRRLKGLLKRLRRSPDLLRKYDSIIREQLDLGIVVPASDSEEPCSKLHYLPHHAVVRYDKTTTKLRIVYDASAKSGGPSLNECLHVGPSLNQKIFDILIRFRVHAITLIADIEKAFLMVQIAKEDQDVLNDEKTELVELKFTRVVFGVTPSPYLLNATIAEHLKRHAHTHYHITEKIKESIYVDDIVTGVNSTEGILQEV